MKKRVIYLAVTLLNALAYALMIPRLPETVALHYNITGQPDRYGSPWEMFAILGLMPVLLMTAYLIYVHATRNNPRITRNRAVEDVIVPVITLFFLFVGWLFYAITQAEGRQNLIGLLLIALGLMMIILSNYMGKVRPNRTLGLRIPWTLKDPVVWEKTHRLAGYLGVACGFVMAAAGLLIFANHWIAAFVTFFGALLMYIAVPTVYAYRLYHKRRAP